MSRTLPDAARGPTSLKARPDLLILFLAVSTGMLALGGWLTSLGFGPWYDALVKPPWQPPGWVFSPVWTTLLTLLAVATWLVARHGPGHPGVRVALTLYAAQVVLNLGWSLLFFTLHAPAWALAEIVVLDLVLLGMVLTYGRVSRPAGLLLVPYLLWLGLATALNAWIVLHN